jgi:diguanylate cyclase (GGDEF)-like protein
MGIKPHLVTGVDDSLLDALPIAAAIIERQDDHRLRVASYNSRFNETVRLSTCTTTDWDDADCLKTGPIGESIHSFFDGVDTAGELDFKDGEGLSSRFFRMKLAPLPRGEGGLPRCLLSVVDRTVEVQAERALRAEMLRDSLTGLPNRLAFTEAIEKSGEKVARDLEHAVLVVDMLRFSRINESMGGIAGDELLITFARRLILALRAGDVLARTGGNEFGVLVSLRRGVEDALKAAERIRQVMAAPFKLSELEIRVECAIGVALMHAGQDPEVCFATPSSR